MNNHFEDAWYYARRTAAHLSRGIREELQPVERRVRAATGREIEDPSRTERLRTKLDATEAKAERRARRAAGRLRERV
ncbi:DUF7553 family protein [Halorussus litoreus]|uniref:DUF7553 family protein n=1 Tax=Halorussus litoreus TaxID=1710536 RepID=UPI000E23E6E3|nr:hypothetical protein [Halorussus litoreus]